MYIHWSDGWREVFAESEFADECADRPRRLWVYKRAAPRRLEEYTLSVDGRVAILDYGGRFADVNARGDREWDVGVLRITFKDESRTSVSKLEWSKHRDGKYRVLDAGMSSWAAKRRRASRFVPGSADRRTREIGARVLRPGQLKFRELLIETFGGACAISGCTIVEALEAAHIMPYRGEQFDHVQNGLLLRADLHRLFDLLLLSIEPSTWKVRLSAELATNPSYAALDNVSLRLPRRPRDQPSAVALKDHWKRFRRNTG